MEEEREVEGLDGWVETGMELMQAPVSLDSDDEPPIDLDEIDLDTVEPEVTEAPVPVSRTYDITICYDRYYNVPHVYLLGAKADGTPLTKEEMDQDISSDHLEQTVTYENHPFLNGKYLSIHPCQHGHVMLRFIERLDNPKAFCAPAYYFLFLKFIHSVIPTIDVATPTIEIAETE
jgi:ubiquitin-like-conjugating enzyme ATG3